MVRILERHVRRVEDRLILLAPPHRAVPSVFLNVNNDSDSYRARLREVQRLRGSIYLDDGAVTPDDLTADGLHRTPEDERAWHFLMLNERGRVTSCVWYLEHRRHSRLKDLRARHCPLGQQISTRRTFQRAVEGEMQRAHRDGLGYAELGGWAVTPEARCTTESLLLALAGYSFGSLLGGSLGMTTATVRHASSTILRRLGGENFEADGVPLPAYFDPRYKCEMELLRFDSRQPNPKYSNVIDQLRFKLESVHVLCGQPTAVAPAVASWAESAIVPQAAA